MPFDGTTTKPSLTALAEILRDRSRWPKGFEWDYSNCKTCAVGLASQLFGKSTPIYTMSLTEGVRIFTALHHGTIKAKDITPEHVADAIDAHLARGK